MSSTLYAPDTAGVTVPISVTFCQTNPATEQCVSAIGPTVTTTIAANATPVFVTASGTVPFDPANKRIFVRFKDAAPTTCGGTSVAVTRGATSVAARTQ